MADLTPERSLESAARQEQTRPITIWWSLAFNTPSEVRARTLMRRVLAALQLAAGEIGYERNPEDPRQYKAAFTTDVAVSSDGPRAAVYEVLRLAGRLGCWWSVSPPRVYPDGVEFSGVLAPPQRFSISGLVWASFRVHRTPPAEGAGDELGVCEESNSPSR